MLIEAQMDIAFHALNSAATTTVLKLAALRFTTNTLRPMLDEIKCYDVMLDFCVPFVRAQSRYCNHEFAKERSSKWNITLTGHFLVLAEIR